MKRLTRQISALTPLMFALLLALRCEAVPPERPNIVLIMTDNHGAWTLGSYGNTDIQTPHLDRMALEGVRFSRAFANNAVCSPTRATYLTGLMPSQHGVHKYIDTKVMMGPEAYSTLAEFATLPQILSENGYTCGLSGKWHLGANMTPQEGFSFWVTKPEGHTTDFVNQAIIENGAVTTLAEHQTPYWTRRGIEFIEANRDRPFFLFLAYNGPYGLGSSALTPPINEFATVYAEEALPSFTRDTPHPWLHNNRQMLNNVTSARKYASEVSAVDAGVGELLSALKRLGLDERTLVIFTADQGLAGGQSGFWGMGDHTRPLTAFDWTMHVPLIARHPGSIPAGGVVDNLVSNYDLLPSVLDYVGLSDEQAADPPSPGRSYTPLLRGKQVDWTNEVYYEFENVRAIRTDTWKYIERLGDPAVELYHLESDPGERLNLQGDAAHEEIQAELQQRLHAFFAAHSEPEWDLWNGGDAKGGLLLGKRPYGE
ncbi:MAG: sulfatase-like hydrolase/transferase [Candidatus Hydrogenedentes bacterium]|nr:sulfatase-like hydrolase/transferase [Candidatus Hydrogenedentota bacterium]